LHQQLRRHEFAGAAEGDTPGLDVISRDVMSSEPAAGDKRSALDEPDTESPTTTTAVQSKARELGRYRSNRRRIDSGLIMSFFTECGEERLEGNKYLPKKIQEKLGDNDLLRLQDDALCMLCYESTDQDRREHVTLKLGKSKSPTAMVHMQHMQRYHREKRTTGRSGLNFTMWG
jgi:hypothetical protein